MNHAEKTLTANTNLLIANALGYQATIEIRYALRADDNWSRIWLNYALRNIMVAAHHANEYIDMTLSEWNKEFTNGETNNG